MNASARVEPITSTTSSARQALGRIPWLSAVSAATLDWLADQAVRHRAPAGVMLFEQAETPTFAQFLLSGEIELLAVRGAKEALVETLRPFDLVLPAAVLNREPYLVRARVQEEAQLLMIYAEAFRRAVAADHAFCLAVLACQSAQFRRRMKLAKAIRLRSAQERIGAYLVALCEANPGVRDIRLPLDKRLIATQLGMTRETFSRALPIMARYGLRVVGDRLHVDDVEAARSAFPYDPLIDGPEPIKPLTLQGNG